VALERFKSTPLPVPPPGPDQQYFSQLIRIIGLYFSQLDSLTPNQAQSYRADDFYGGDFSGSTVTANTVTAGQFTGGDFDGVEANFARLYSGLISGNFQGGNGVFNNLTGSSVNGSLFTGSGRQLNFPHIGASGNADQYATADDTPTIVQWDTADELQGFTLNIDNTATPTYSGVYKITYGLQFANTDNAAHDIVIWIRVNNVDVAKSAVQYTLPARKSAGVPSYLLAGSTIVFDIQAGQSVGLWWATDKAYSTTGPVDGVYIEYLPAQTTPYAHPAVPASIGDISYVSAPFPPKTQVALVGVAGVGAVGSVSILVY